MKKEYNAACFFICVLFFVATTNAQKQFNNWYFGNRAGVSFASGSPVALSPGAMNQLEGCSSISDKNGNLLFYTDGINIWDKTHRVMPNGSGLMGDASSATSAFIAPVIGSGTRFYVLTADGYTCDETNGPLGSFDGLFYSIVDMSLPGNGYVSAPLGAVDTAYKNINLMDSVDERITAAIHSNGIDYWVITKGYEEYGSGFCRYYAYLVTCSGIDTIPVISNIACNSPLDCGLGFGLIKASADGKCIINSSRISVLDFDNATGILSNQRKIGDGNFSYGVEFSPNDSLIYVGSGYHPPNSLEIYQYERFASDISSTQISFTISSSSIGAFQLAPDDNIYFVAGANCLGKINNPNSKGNCTISECAVGIPGPASNVIGLPNAYIHYWRQERDTHSCVAVVSNLPPYIPTSFTPNNDGLNDVLFVYYGGELPITYHLKIYNRWGNLFFESKSPIETWDGKLNGVPVKEDVYVLQLNYSFEGGDEKNLNSTLLVAK